MQERLRRDTGWTHNVTDTGMWECLELKTWLMKMKRLMTPILGITQPLLGFWPDPEWLRWKRYHQRNPERDLNVISVTKTWKQWKRMKHIRKDIMLNFNKKLTILQNIVIYFLCNAVCSFLSLFLYVTFPHVLTCHASSALINQWLMWVLRFDW